MKRKIIFFVLVGLLATPLASALTVLQLNLQQLIGLADRVFVGKCLSVKFDTDGGGRPVQYVTYQVEDLIKGPASDRVTFKQLGASDDQMQRQEGDLTVVSVFRELPRYQAGEESIIFLSEEGSLGLTAPIGLQQGKFAVATDASGQKTVANGMGNHGLFMGLSQSPKVKAMALSNSDKKLMKQNGGDLVYDDFVSLVKRLAAQ